MTYDEILKAVKEGKLVHWKNSSYRVENDKKDKVLINYLNKNWVALSKEVFENNYDGKDFYVEGEKMNESMNFSEYCSYLKESREDYEFSDEQLEALKKAGFPQKKDNGVYMDFFSNGAVRNCLFIIPVSDNSVNVELYGSKIKDDELVETMSDVDFDSVVKNLPKLVKAIEKWIDENSKFMDVFYSIDE